MHNVLCVRHLSYQKTIVTVRSQLFWPRMKKCVVDYIAICMECPRVKLEHRHPVGLLKTLPILEKKWEVVTIDVMTKFLKTKREYD